MLYFVSEAQTNLMSFYIYIFADYLFYLYGFWKTVTDNPKPTEIMPITIL